MPRQPHYPLGERPLTEYLRLWAEQQPNKIAIIAYGYQLTYADLDNLSNRFANLLISNGAMLGDRVAVLMQTCPQFHVAFWGILKSGCIHVPISPSVKEMDLRYQLVDCGAKFILAEDRLLSLVANVQSKSDLRTIFYTSLADILPKAPAIPIPDSISQDRITSTAAIDLFPALHEVSDELPRTIIGLNDVAALNYTGGTTGMPKGCVHTQGDMIYTAANACAASFLGNNSTSLNYYPIFWMAGELNGLLYPILSGCTLVELIRWDAVGWLTAIQKYQVTNATLIVDSLVEVMEHPKIRDFDLHSLRNVRVASFVKKLTPELRRRWRELSGTTLMESGWGMTETHATDTFVLGTQEGDRDLGSKGVFVGRPMPGTVIKICDFESGVPVDLGREGEIVVRTPSLMKAYWNNPDATSSLIAGGWFHTGDIGMYDADGFLHFLGRKKEMLKVSGISVFPAEIEGILGQHPAIIAVGVIGIADERRGQMPVAFVKLDPNSIPPISAQELEAWCRENMASYKVPQIRILPDLPMTATGKVRKADLAKLSEYP